jgi:triacylglycerol lipase
VQIDRWNEAAEGCGEPRRRNVKSGHSPIDNARKAVGMFRRAALVHASELTLMASTAMRAPLCLVSGGFDTARDLGPTAQPPRAVATRPVLLVHGFCGTKASWSFVAQILRARGATVEAFTYPPFGTSVERLANKLVIEVRRILSQTGADKVHLVGHSLGGVVIAQAVTDDRLEGLVDTVCTLGSPFGGSPWAKLVPFGGIARALRKDSPLLRRLACAPAPEGVRWLAFTAALDFIVPGVRSVPAHGQAERITVGGAGHLGILLSRHVVERIAEALPACGIVDALAA